MYVSELRPEIFSKNLSLSDDNIDSWVFKDSITHGHQKQPLVTMFVRTHQHCKDVVLGLLFALPPHIKCRTEKKQIACDLPLLNVVV